MKIKVRLLLGLLALCTLSGCLQASFPSIGNPDQLVKDCDALIAAGRNRMLPPDQWPDSIRMLHPVYVCVDDSDVMITLEAGGEEGARGIFVSHGTPFAGHQTLSSTPDANIYHFEWAR